MSEKNQETLTFGAEISKVLKLMIHSLYTNRDIFLRELISNASDACDKLRYEALTRPELLEGGGEFKIRVSFNENQAVLQVADNGIGMNREELVRNLGTIAKSGTGEFLEHLTGDAGKDVSLIGQFGVGFYASFMVAERVRVVSRKAGEPQAYAWESDGAGEYTVGTLPEGEAHERGTVITLYMKDDAKEYLDFFRLQHIIRTYSDHIAFPIELERDGNFETVNKGSALWARPKQEITEEQYQEFYRHVAHTPDTPWLTLHQKVEGKLEYSYLLFVPSLKPFDLFHPDRKRRVKLYVKRVFITDEGVDIIPHYLRFLRGVVDSEDLPLNISRENLQHNPFIAKMREGIAKKVLQELARKADENPEAYAKFWKDFGPVVKEGLCEAGTPRELLLNACRFESTHEAGLTSLSDYISRMKPGQEDIYYLTGDRLDVLKQNPQLEGFRKRGIEVLLFTDHVDDFWLTLVQDFEGKPLKSITRSDIDLNAVEKADDAPAESEESEKAAAGKIDALAEAMKRILGQRVQDVRTTSKLTDSAVTLALAEGAMSSRLERFLIEQKQLPGASAKVLEMNPSHPIIKKLAEKVESNSDQAMVEDAVKLLFEQACIIEGDEIAEPAAFAKRMSAFMEKSLSA